MNKINSSDFVRLPALSAAVIAGMLFGLVPQLLVYFTINSMIHLAALLSAAYASLFASLALLPLGAGLARRACGASRHIRGLRVAIIIEALGLSVLWHNLLNPFPLGPLLQHGQYMPLLLTALALIFSWLLFWLILRKLL